jgi:hypothetical protein
VTGDPETEGRLFVAVAFSVSLAGGVFALVGSTVDPGVGLGVALLAWPFLAAGCWQAVRVPR